MVLILVRCPHCRSDQGVKRGKMGNDKQRYLCQNQDCSKLYFPVSSRELGDTREVFR
jgi:transposase-like protein